MDAITRKTKLDELKENQLNVAMTGIPLRYKGTTRTENVYRIPLDYLIYNKYNGRIGSDVLSYEKQNGVLNAELDGDKAIIEKFLYDSKVDRNKTTMESLLKNGQQRYGIVTSDGTIVDGNRRAMLLNRLFYKREELGYSYEEVEKCKYFLAIILPDDAEEKDIQQLETIYQMGEDDKLDYNPIEKYLKCKELKRLGFSEEDIAGFMSEKPSQIKEWINVLDLMEDYLKEYDYEGIYTRLEKTEGPFVDLENYLDSYKKKKSNVRNADWAYSDSDISDLKLVCFDYIRARYEGKEFRDIRSMLSKYGFTEKKTESSEKILLDFYEEERKFDEFSQKALRIRNNECDKVEFEEFTNSIACHLPTRSLYPLQLLSAYHMAFSQNACNFSVPGAGKTSIVYGAYAYLHSLPNDNAKHIDKLLIVGPLSSFGPWELEYEECFGHKPSVKRLISGISKTDKQDYLISSRTSELTLISYASLISLQKELVFFLRNNKAMVVLDEAHKAKNSSGGVIAQAVLELAKYSSARVVLTGTPAPNGYEDIYNMFKFIWPTKNIIGFEINQLRDITAMGDRARIERLISNISPFFIRIRKSDLNIPPATINPPIVVPMGEYQRRIYDFIEKKYMDEMIGEGEPDLSSKFKIALAHARMIRLMQAASDPAMLRTPLNEFLEDDECPLEAYQAIDDADVLKAIIEYEAIETPSKFLAVEKIVRQIIEDGGKVVIWATFIHTIHSIKEYLESKGIQCQELYGAIPVEKEGTIDDGEEQILTREKIVRAFQDDNCPFKVIIANPFAVAESISLHKACHNAIYLERSFNAAHFVQSKDRIHRYGLKEGTKTNYYYILSEDSIDETIDARLAEKEHRMNEIMESMPIPLFDNASDDLGDEDIKALIKDYVRRTKKI